MKIPLTAYEVAHIRKALAGGFAAALPLLAADLADLHVSAAETSGLLGAFILGVGAVFGIKNKPADPGKD